MKWNKRKNRVPVITRKKPEGVFNTLFGFIRSRDIPKRCNVCLETGPLENFYIKSRKDIGDEPDIDNPNNYRPMCIPCYDERYS